jgi:hypothetical protein
MFFFNQFGEVATASDHPQDDLAQGNFFSFFFQIACKRI